MIFDRYTEESLKSGIRTGRTGNETVRYKISDDTIVEHLTPKQFLSDIKTKQNLTKYLHLEVPKLLHQFSLSMSSLLLKYIFLFSKCSHLIDLFFHVVYFLLENDIL